GDEHDDQGGGRESSESHRISWKWRHRSAGDRRWRVGKILQDGAAMQSPCSGVGVLAARRAAGRSPATFPVSRSGFELPVSPSFPASRFQFPVASVATLTSTGRFPTLLPVHILSRVLLSAALVVLSVTAPVVGVRAQAPDPPKTTARPVDFARDIQPILQRSCVRCHARGRVRGGFSIETRERFLAGGDSGPAVIPGNSGAS